MFCHQAYPSSSFQCITSDGSRFERKLHIHLFVRDTKLSQGTAAPFVYHGPVNYVRHVGSAPMSVTLALSG